MSLDQESWVKLLTGLTDASKRGDLKWRRKEPGSVVDPYRFSRSGLSALAGGQTLYAQTSKTVYELIADPFGRAPYEFSVFDRSGKVSEPIAHYKSSTAFENPLNVLLNKYVDDLFQAASQTIEEPSAIVNRLLGEIGKA